MRLNDEKSDKIESQRARKAYLLSDGFEKTGFEVREVVLNIKSNILFKIEQILQ